MTVSRPRRRGTYAPLAARYYEDEKVMHLTPMAELLFVRVLAFCASSMSDGFISDAQLRATAGLVRRYGRAKDQLVKVGLWERDEIRGGFRVVSWLKWNPSADDIRAGQAQDAERKRKHGSRRNPAGNEDRSSRNPAGFLPSDTDTDTEFSNRTPPGSVRLETRAGRSRAPQAAPRPSQNLTVVNAGKPPDLSRVRAQLASASAAARARATRRVDPLGELVRRTPRPLESDSGGSE